MLDALRQSYLHVWTLKDTHACFVTYTEHAGKCKNAWDQLYTDRIREEGFLVRTREVRAHCQESHNKSKETSRVQDVFRGFEETVKTVESPFHEWWVDSAWIDLVCDSQYCLYCCLTLLAHCLYCNMYYLYIQHCVVTLQSGARSPEEKKEQVWKGENGKGKQRSQLHHPEDVDSVSGGK
jgi:hypothetical protein